MGLSQFYSFQVKIQILKSRVSHPFHLALAAEALEKVLADTGLGRRRAAEEQRWSRVRRRSEEGRRRPIVLTKLPATGEGEEGGAYIMMPGMLWIYCTSPLWQPLYMCLHCRYCT